MCTRCPRCDMEFFSDAPGALCSSCRAPADASLNETCLHKSETPEKLNYPTGSWSPEGDTRSYLPSASYDTDASPVGPAAPAPELPSKFGDYELLDRLGQGGMGIVFRARQRSANRIVALKLIRADKLADRTPEQQSESLRRFRLEAQLAARLDHDHVVSVYEVGQWQDRPYYSMKYVEGQSLHELLRAGPLDARRSARYVLEAARGVQEAHLHGILHRDLKPHNILISARSDRALVADFGLAKLAEVDGGLSLSGDVFGTPNYMSPEQAFDSSRVTVHSDVYSLGATLYHALTGRPAFQAPNFVATLEQVVNQAPVALRLLNSAIDRDLETICLKALSKEPERRYSSAERLADDLQCYLAGKPISARPAGIVERSWRWSRRNPLVAALGLGVAFALVAGTTVSMFFAWQANQRAHEALVEKERADLGYQEARRTVNRFFTVVSENTLLARPGLEPLRKELLELALEYYQKFQAETEHDPVIGNELAETASRLSLVLSDIGSKQQALAAIQQSVRLREQLVRHDPQSFEMQEQLSEDYLNAADLYASLGDVEQAHATIGKGRLLAEHLVQVAPEQPKFRVVLARHYLAEVQLFEHRESELDSCRNALAVLDEVDTSAHDLPSVDHLRAAAYQEIAKRSDNELEAADFATKAILIREDLLKRPDVIPAYRPFSESALADSHWQLALIHQRNDRLREAAECRLRSIQLQRKIVAESEHVPQFREALVRRLIVDSLQQQAQLDASGGEPEAGDAVGQATILVETDSNNSEWQELLTTALLRRGDALGAQQRWADAAAMYTQAHSQLGERVDLLACTALLQAAANDETACQRTRAELMKTASDDLDLRIAPLVILAFVLGHPTDAEQKRAVEIASRYHAAYPEKALTRVLLGAAQFRGGQIQEAHRDLRLASKCFPATAPPSTMDVGAVKHEQLLGAMFLMLVEHRQGTNAIENSEPELSQWIAAIDRWLEQPKIRATLPWTAVLPIDFCRKELRQCRGELPAQP